MKRIVLIALCVFASFAVATPLIAEEHHRNYAGHHGYRERPYDRNRHYGHYSYKGYSYRYQGHWRSWDDWDRYAREHPDIYKHGGYYHEGGHLMFRYCEPGTGNCFFFSIGR
jgi:hypothetical protein